MRFTIGFVAGALVALIGGWLTLAYVEAKNS